jgi:hypothetical protein
VEEFVMSKRVGTPGQIGKRRPRRAEHTYIGRNVFYQRKVWRVISAYSNGEGKPWLTLRRGSLELAVKSYEVRIAFD